MTTRLCDDPTRDDMLDYLFATHANDPWDGPTDIDIEEAIYWFASDWHGGQGSNLYAALCASPFTPSILASYIDAEGPAGVLYDELEARYTTLAAARSS